MRILLTGGTGFIGSNIVVGYLKDKHEVAVVSNLSYEKRESLNKKAKFYKADIRNKEVLEKVFKDFKPEIVNHHAGHTGVKESVENPVYDAEINIIGSINVFELAVKCGVRRIIFPSTGGGLYGEPAKLPANENTPIEPISPYGVSKYCVENYLNYFKRLYGIERVILRYANVYGPRQEPLGKAGVVEIFTGKILKGETPVIYGDGTQTCDYIFVEDVVRANILALHGQEGIYNIGTGTETSVNELIKIISKVLGREVKPEYAPPRKWEVKRISLDIGRAKKELGFAPKCSLEEGIRRTIEWYSERQRDCHELFDPSQ
jgi:UDP-glucose 4-epimerase